MKTLIHKILYRTLPLEGYLRAVSRLFFLWQRLGIGRYAPATEYVYHLPRLVRAGDTAVDIGANLGYYARTLSRLAGPAGRVYAVEPVPPIGRTDLPGGDYSWIMRSILDSLIPLGEEVRVYPGHGPESTIGHEMLYNPFVVEVLNQEVNYKN